MQEAFDEQEFAERISCRGDELDKIKWG